MLNTATDTVNTFRTTLKATPVMKAARFQNYPLPPSISLSSAALIEPLAVAWHAVTTSPFDPNRTSNANTDTLIIGGGPVGISLVQILTLHGATAIAVAELLPSRKTLARDYGAIHILDPHEVDIPSTLRSLTNGVGADIVFDTTGVESTLNGAIGQSNLEKMITQRIRLDEVVEKGFRALVDDRRAHYFVLW
ncbi:NAD(P)-binding protein [Aspergillus heteromorphus CBS 117.55]|uniref:NAD(P)-binding protein n=1 Tax=Aspergillus heteromorphus CBS 117.55 TaxID=1448321 RepID=A0A317WVI9_9EURO|nr:NAD(P)-binding protein [Aspergillus heteromorphus CBS 117.55]PWY89841.1 NAD(P)-binding protein [Aspergillus heteromorphus CBS 117.55]